MSKRTSQIIWAGQLRGAKLKIKAVENNGLHSLPDKMRNIKRQVHK